MGRPNVVDAPIIEALRAAGSDGILATDIVGAIGVQVSVRGAQFALERLMATGTLGRRFEWALWPEGTPKAGLPRTRVYRYFVREVAPEDAEVVA
jgi:hypothetical protein